MIEARTIAEIIADLAAQACGTHKLVPVDTMRLFRAMQALEPAELDLLVQELTNGACCIVPAQPPAPWNPAMCRGYSILIERARRQLRAPSTAPDG